MKKFFVIAAMTAIALSSCVKDSGVGKDKLPEGMANLTIKVSSSAGTRALEEQGTDVSSTIEFLPNASLLGHIFIVDASGNVLSSSQKLEKAAQTNPLGQALTKPVEVGSQVYIVANIPALEYDALVALKTIGAVKAAASRLVVVGATVATGQTNYKQVALANQGGTPVIVDAPDAGETTTTVDITLNPLISRLELHAIKALNVIEPAVNPMEPQPTTGSIINSFKVTAVYLDSYYYQFTWGGSFYDNDEGLDALNGNKPFPDLDKFEQGMETDTFTGLQDVGNWVATSVGGTMTAVADASPTTPAVDEVWAHNVAAGSCPRFIIKIQDIMWTPKDASVPVAMTTGTEARYVTITGYTGVTAFTRGKIYRITNLVFSPKDLKNVPNPEEFTLNAKVTIKEWELETINPIL